MKKTERINDMLIFLNNKRSFNLKDLMERYHISKSTALRDVQSLEEIGVPIYSELGRNGCYKILENKILSPIFFNIDEMYAIYFALLTLKGYKSKPFNIENKLLEDKFKNILPKNVLSQITTMEKVLSFEVTNHSNFSQYLKQILQGIFEEKVYDLVYLKRGEKVRLVAQFIRMESKFGQWYAKVYQFKTDRIKILRCDKIQSIKETTKFTPKKLDVLLSDLETFHKAPDAINFEVRVNKAGKDIFDKENYPSMNISKENEDYVISGYFNSNEIDFIANYFLRFGLTIHSIEPVKLKQIVQNKILSIQQHLTSI